MIEKHPFEPFIPTGCEVVVIGSFPGKESTQEIREDDWYYGANRNQFWQLLETIYNLKLKTKSEKQHLFEKAKIGIADLIESCERSENKNSDSNLIHIVYNSKIPVIVSNYPIKKILFTSKSVYSEYVKQFGNPKNISLITLPSPSPIYRRMSFQIKAENYRKYFPVL